MHEFATAYRKILVARLSKTFVVLRTRNHQESIKRSFDPYRILFPLIGGNMAAGLRDIKCEMTVRASTIQIYGQTRERCPF
jgi:hypothetical protein